MKYVVITSKHHDGFAMYDSKATPFGQELGAFSETEKDKDGKPISTASDDWRCTTIASSVLSAVRSLADIGRLDESAGRGRPSLEAMGL